MSLNIYACFLCFLIVSIAPVSAQTTIQDVLRTRPDLSTTLSLMDGTISLNTLGLRTGVKYTFFAPHNSAYKNISLAVMNRLQQLPKDTLNALFQYHSAMGERRTTMVSAANPVVSISSLQNGSSKLFMVLEDQVYINGARFIERDLDSVSGTVTNGVLHIIDRVFVDMSVPSTNTYNYIHDYLVQNTQQPYRTIEFSRLLDQYNIYASQGTINPGPSGMTLIDGVINNADYFSTTFVPSDVYMSALKVANQEMYQSLTTGSPQFLQTVMESHVIPGKVYHSNLLEAVILANKTVNAMRGTVTAYWFNGDLYISNNCVSAKVVVANLTVSNGVVHIVDNLLGYVYNDLKTQILRTGDLSDLNGAVVSATPDFQAMLTVLPGVGSVPDSKRYTIFAPSNAAFASGEIDFSQNQDTKIMQLNMHILAGQMELREVKNGTRRQTLRSGYQMIFYEIGVDRFVEVDYVRAKILKGNICTKNGIIHIIDKILGVPARTVFEEVTRNPQLVSLRDVVKNTGVEQTLNDMTRAVTLFAPIEDAFVLMRQSARGNDLLNRQNYLKLRNVMLRMMVRDNVFMDQIGLNQRKNYETYFDTITVINENGEYYVLLGSQKIHIVQANIRMKNGVVHLVDKVLFDPDNPNAGEWTSSHATKINPSLLLVLFNCLTLLMHVNGQFHSLSMPVTFYCE